MPRPAAFAASVLAALLLSACVVAPYPTRPVVYEQGPMGPVAVTEVAPPPPYVEPVPVAPFAGAIWIGGYWNWSGGRHVWVPGHYEHPRPGYHWEEHHWENHAGRWELHGGQWRR
ncbi:MAG TPA: hypothetical protein VMU47_21235 [Caldimonas sp.]|nr:hypothetical protein [Caldimonas sp.]